MKLTVSVTQVGFSRILTVKDALKSLRQAGDTILIDDTVFPNQKKMGNNLHNVVPLHQGCKVTPQLHIDLMLLASAQTAGETLIQVEKVCGSKDVHGPVDSVFKFNDQTVCVTKGKKDDIGGGVIQNLAQLLAVSDDCKRRFSDILARETEDKPIHGIAFWQ